MPPTSNEPKSAPFTPELDRRVSPRLQPHEVPWIREVKPISGDGARLLNISRTGVLLETTARLQPGRRSTVVIVNDADQKERAEGQVVRTELVAIGKSGELIYRTALAFTREFDLKLPGAPAPTPAADTASCVQLQLEGPLPGLWATAAGSCRVEVAHISATGCYVLLPGVGTADEWASVTVFFSPVRSLTLQGTVAAAESERGCLLRFANLDADTRRALRVEIREGIADGQTAPPQPVALGTVMDSGVHDVVVEWHARAGTLHANQW
jgi:PilZ domain-containing protein